MDLLRKTMLLVDSSTMHAAGDSCRTADWVMALTDEDGSPAASMITASRAECPGYIAFCTAAGGNKPKRIKKDPRACVYLFDSETFTGVSLSGEVEIASDRATKETMWYDALGEVFSGPADENWCVLIFRPERYNIFIDNKTIRGEFQGQAACE